MVAISRRYELGFPREPRRNISPPKDGSNSNRWTTDGKWVTYFIAAITIGMTAGVTTVGLATGIPLEEIPHKIFQSDSSQSLYLLGQLGGGLLGTSLVIAAAEIKG